MCYDALQVLCPDTPGPHSCRRLPDRQVCTLIKIEAKKSCDETTAASPRLGLCGEKEKQSFVIS